MTTDAPIYMTPDCAAQMRAELKELLYVKRPDTVRRVADAAAEGDRSENAEYIYGKKQLREIDGRVRFLSKRLDELTVVSRPPSESDRVFFGAWVTLENEANSSVASKSPSVIGYSSSRTGSSPSAIPIRRVSASVPATGLPLSPSTILAWNTN